MTQTNETQLTIDGIFRLISTGQFGPAEEYCRSYLEQAPDDINVLGLLGAILLKLERPQDAKPVLEKTIRLEPEFAKPHEDLGFLHLRTGDPEQAIRCFEEAIRLDAEQPGAWSGLADALMHHGDRERADPVYTQYPPLRPEDVAEAVLFVATRPPHVVVHDLILMPQDQASVFASHQRGVD